MILNVVLGFVIPWIFGLILIFKAPKILLIIAPAFSSIAYLVNEFGFHTGYWRFAPLHITDDLTTVSLNMGLFPVLASYLVYAFERVRLNPYLLVFAFSLTTTGAEYAGTRIQMVTYGNGWNIGWTLVSYLIPFLLVYWYYRALVRLGVFGSP